MSAVTSAWARTSGEEARRLENERDEAEQRARAAARDLVVLQERRATLSSMQQKLAAAAADMGQMPVFTAAEKAIARGLHAQVERERQAESTESQAGQTEHDPALERQGNGLSDEGEAATPSQNAPRGGIPDRSSSPLSDLGHTPTPPRVVSREGGLSRRMMGMLSLRFLGARVRPAIERIKAIDEVLSCCTSL